VQLGDKVKRGQLLAEIDPLISASKVAEATATLANLQAQWEGKKAQFELARLQKSRSDDLRRQGAQATSDSEIAVSNYKLAHSALQALEAQIKQAQAELETAQVNLAYTRITAPMDGEVVSINALEGQTLNATQQAPTILRIAQLDTMTVWALVPEADVSRLRTGQDVYFTGLGRGERRWHGRLRQILPSPQVIANVIFYNALFDVPNPQRELKVQMTAQVFFVLAQANDALYVPLSALGATHHSGRAGPHTVRVLGEDGSIEARRVQVGITNAVAAQILSGLNEGETVVTGTASLTQDHYKPSPLHNVKPR
jgi:macrolide-specific efflux system membrane fusion protein